MMNYFIKNECYKVYKFKYKHKLFLKSKDENIDHQG